jgi:hypothetical protein
VVLDITFVTITLLSDSFRLHICFQCYTDPPPPPGGPRPFRSSMAETAMATVATLKPQTANHKPGGGGMRPPPPLLARLPTMVPDHSAAGWPKRPGSSCNPKTPNRKPRACRWPDIQPVGGTRAYGDCHIQSISPTGTRATGPLKTCC